MTQIYWIFSQLSVGDMNVTHVMWRTMHGKLINTMFKKCFVFMCKSFLKWSQLL